MKKVLCICAAVCFLAACGGKEASLFSKAQRLTQKEQFAKAIQVYSQIIKNNPQNYAAYASRGLLYERLKAKDAKELQKNKQAAQRDYERAVELNYQRPEIFNNLAALYIDQGRYEEAEQLLNQALAFRPNYVLAFVNRGVALSKQNKIGPALLDFARAEELDPQFTLTYLNRGLAEYAAGLYASAAEDYAVLLDLNPKDARAYLERGRAIRRMGYFQNALDDFHQAMALRPDYAMPYYYAAELLFSHGDKDESLAYAERAKLLAPNYAPAYELMGDMLSLESPVEATQHYLAARRLDPAHATKYQNKIKMMTTETGRQKVVLSRLADINKK